MPSCPKQIVNPPPNAVAIVVVSVSAHRYFRASVEWGLCHASSPCPTARLEPNVTALLPAKMATDTGGYPWDGMGCHEICWPRVSSTPVGIALLDTVSHVIAEVGQHLCDLIRHSSLHVRRLQISKSSPIRLHLPVDHNDSIAVLDIVPFVSASLTMSRVSSQIAAVMVPLSSRSRSVRSRYIKCGSAGRLRNSDSAAVNTPLLSVQICSPTMKLPSSSRR